MDGLRHSHWHSFLEEEGKAQEGLFCFYELEKPPRVLHCCTALLEHLPAFLDANWESQDPED